MVYAARKYGIIHIRGIDMVYKYYKKCRDAVWRILLDAEVDSLPVNIVALCRKLGVRVKRYELADDENGVSLLTTLGPLILIRPELSSEKKRYVLAHELGHFILGHVEEFGQMCSKTNDADNPMEREAEAFAVRLLAPACVLWGCGISDASQLESLCDIPPEIAQKRMKRMKVLNERNSYLRAESEKAVYKQFSGFIENYNREHGNFESKK